MNLYTEQDPYYVETPLDSPVPPPQLSRRGGFKYHHDGMDLEGKAKMGGGIGEKLMRAAGWAGAGLGKNSQGIVEPVSASDKHDRLGLGFKAPNDPIKRRKHTIDVGRYFPHHQDFELISCNEVFVASDMIQDIRLDPHKPVDYNVFCDERLVQNLFLAKGQFDPVPHMKFIAARRLANPYETIGKSIFINRAAVKMANMDAMFHVTPKQCDASNFFFADVCAGPGGFTEYILWRTESRARGFGFTLKGEDDFTPWAFNRQPTNTFKTYYGEDETGDITKSSNMRHFFNIVKTQTKVGVDLVTADGGFSVEGDENYQEEHLKQLVLCQFLTALSILKPHGNFICKVFDTFTPFVPYTSRPANSERYIVCLDYQVDSPEVRDYLFRVNDELNRLKKWGTPGEPNVMEVVPIARIMQDRTFVDYVTEQNRRQATGQVESLNELMKYVEDEGLLPLDQADVRRRCYREWNLPDPSTENAREAMRRDAAPYQHRRRETPYDAGPDRRGSNSSGYFPPQKPYTPSMLPSYPPTPVGLGLMTSYRGDATPTPALPVETSTAMLSREDYEKTQRQRAQERRGRFSSSNWKTSSSCTASASSTPRAGSPDSVASNPTMTRPALTSTLSSGSLSQPMKRRESAGPSTPIAAPLHTTVSGPLTANSSSQRQSMPSPGSKLTQSRQHSVADLEAAFNAAPTAPTTHNPPDLLRKSSSILADLAVRKPSSLSTQAISLAASSTPSNPSVAPSHPPTVSTIPPATRIMRKRAMVDFREDNSEEENPIKRVRVSVATPSTPPAMKANYEHSTKLEQDEDSRSLVIVKNPTNPRCLTLRIS
eukprot:Ihof_evm2s402 gene=Ihof_evmTU2s402